MDIVPSPFSSSFDTKPPFLVPIVPCLQIFTDFTQLSPSSPEAPSGTFNITEGYIELASDPITDRNTLWIILKREKLDQWRNSQRISCGQNRNSINHSWILHLQTQGSRPASLLEFQNELRRRRGKRVRLSRMPRPSRLYEDRDRALCQGNASLHPKRHG
ncbi:hypothetical protein BGZ61DRAFT_487648 [Ilyonectria robusta]|uniref:uncharacterized protein n=1 Tax=Ilyonectria robusta TaxID=1079257 RepID=UPI001E8CB55C|nr:uncharacterized protein BGZ61DRAFT_487648 [Ilyonectria robusta]KAH8651702.1 hypothetical protein BGZ61DRAFT_487648 [Ilyonectria robusta]